MVNFIRGNLIIFTMSMLFIFSTLYTLVFYYNQAVDSLSPGNGLTDLDSTTNQSPTDNSILSAITSGFIDDLLGFLSILNPFGLIILLLKAITPTDLYTFLDLILLRPIGWTGTIITSDLVIRYIRGVSE